MPGDIDKSAQRGIKLQDREHITPDDVLAALLRDNPGELALASITVAMAPLDLSFAQEVCIFLGTHGHPRVRANALTGLGHLARRLRVLDEKTVKPIIEKSLNDPDADVRTSAESAADEIHQFLHWNITGHSYGSVSASGKSDTS